MSDPRIEDLSAEIERLGLRTEVERLRIHSSVLMREIERLRDQMRALATTGVDRDTAGIFKGLWQGSEKECDELRADIERLTAALQEIVTRHDEADDGCYAGQLADMARRALEPKP